MECSVSLNSPEISCVNCLRKRYSLFRYLSGEDLAILEKSRYRITYQEGETIYKEGAKPFGLLCLHGGKVKIIRKGVDDNDQIIALKKPSDFIGLEALIQEHHYTTSAIALETSAVCIIDRKDFFDVLRKNTRLPLEIIRVLAKEVEQTNERLLTLTRKHMRARMADGLFWVFDTYGTLSDKETLNVCLKRSDLAALCNMTTANAIRILSAFSKEHLIEMDQRKIRIKNIQGLREVSLLGR